MNPLPEIIYLHGLGSSPRSDKARLITDHLRGLGYSAQAPSLSVPSLSALDIEEALRVVQGCLERVNSPSGAILIGSSFGGFLALQATQRAIGRKGDPLVKALVLLAPVVFPWHPTCGMITEAMEEHWAQKGAFPVHESESGLTVNVHIEFVRQLKSLTVDLGAELLPTLIIHGERDEVVPIQQSVEFCRRHPGTALIKLDDTHQLLAHPSKLVSAIQDFVIGL